MQLFLLNEVVLVKIKQKNIYYFFKLETLIYLMSHLCLIKKGSNIENQVFYKCELKNIDVCIMIKFHKNCPGRI